MAFESVRGYVQLASGLGELTRARALEAAQGTAGVAEHGGDHRQGGGAGRRAGRGDPGCGVRQPREPHRPRARRGGRCRLPTGPGACCRPRRSARRGGAVARRGEPFARSHDGRVQGDAGAGTAGRRAGSRPRSPRAHRKPPRRERAGRDAPPRRPRRPPRAPSRDAVPRRRPLPSAARCARPVPRRRPPPCGARHGRLQSGRRLSRPSQ